MAVYVKDNSKEFKSAYDKAIERALVRCGMTGERYAKYLVPTNKRKYGGSLKNSITWEVDPSEPSVSIGTNMEYAA